MSYTNIHIPPAGTKITVKPDLTLEVPTHPIIPFITGDGIGQDVTPVMKKVVDAAVEKAYHGQRKIEWMEIYAGEKAVQLYGSGQYLPDETVTAIREYLVSIKGPLATPVGGGIRSINVSLRQLLDLYVCLRPVRYLQGLPSPVHHPERIDMVIFRENTEDIYSGIEWPAGSADNAKVIEFLTTAMGAHLRFSDFCGIGIKPISKAASQRLVEKAIQYAIDHDRSSVTLVHKGNIMKFTEGAFQEWGYEVARVKFGARKMDNSKAHVLENPKFASKAIVVKDVLADSFFQQILLRPEDYSVIATTNLNGDYISDALAAEIGGIGIAPGTNLSDTHALFEPTHGTAPKYACQDKVNPTSMILSAGMMLAHLGWVEAAGVVHRAVEATIASKAVTYDLERQLPGATLLSCSQFGDAVIQKFPP